MARRLPLLYAFAIVAEIVGLGYLYVTDPPASSAPLNVNLGWIGLGSMVTLLVYSFARRSRGLRRFAKLSYWLHFHIFLAVQGFVLVLFHCWHLFVRDTEVMTLNPGVLNLIAVCVVFGSGLFGRYLYSTLPRTIGGVQMASRDVDAELAGLGSDLGKQIERLWKEDLIAPRGFFGMISADLKTRAALRELGALDLSPEQREIAQRKVRLERRRAALKVGERLFRYWIVLHRPIAAIMYILSIVHVLLSYMFTPSLGQ